MRQNLADELVLPCAVGGTGIGRPSSATVEISLLTRVDQQVGQAALPYIDQETIPGTSR